MGVQWLGQPKKGNDAGNSHSFAGWGRRFTCMGGKDAKIKGWTKGNFSDFFLFDFRMILLHIMSLISFASTKT